MVTVRRLVFKPARMFSWIKRIISSLVNSNMQWKVSKGKVICCFLFTPPPHTHLFRRDRRTVSSYNRQCSAGCIIRGPQHTISVPHWGRSGKQLMDVKMSPCYDYSGIRIGLEFICKIASFWCLEQKTLLQLSSCINTQRVCRHKQHLTEPWISYSGHSFKMIPSHS